MDSYFLVYSTDRCPSNAHFRLHDHDGYEIFLFLEGDTNYIIEENTYTLNPGDIILVRNKQMHQTYHNRPVRYSRINISLFPFFFSENHCEKYETSFLPGAYHKGSKISADVANSSGLSDAFMRLQKYSDNFTQKDSPIVIATLIEILYLIHNVKNYSFAENTNSQIKAVITYINKNFTAPITLETLEKEFFLSKYYLCHSFSKATGLTIHQYITNKRLILANDMIKGGKDIHLAAELSGFNSYSAFYRAYVNKYHLSPQQLRNHPGPILTLPPIIEH